MRASGTALPLLSLLALGAGCFYSFPTEQKTACPPSGECAEGFACLGGTCVDATRALCTAGDRRCVGQIAWTCGRANSETGEDCAAAGKVCFSGTCMDRCDSSCATCDETRTACVKALPSDSSSCDASRNEACQDGVCVAMPPGLTVPEGKLSCYPPALPAKGFGGRVVGLDGTGVQASGTLLFTGDTFQTDVEGRFDKPGVIVSEGSILQVRFDEAFGIAGGLHLGPQLTDQPGQVLSLLAMTQGVVTTLIDNESASAAGPKWEPTAKGILIGRVRDCDGVLMQNATFGLSIPAGRMGYLGKPDTLMLQRQGAQATVKGLGVFVAYDLPIGVDFKVVVVVRKQPAVGLPELVQLFSQVVRIEKPATFEYGVTTLDVGRGAPPQ